MSTVRIDYTQHLEDIKEMLRDAPSMNNYQPAIIRFYGTPDFGQPWVELFLGREIREAARIGQGIPHPDNVTVTTMIRVEVPGVDWAIAAKERDALVGAVITAIYDMKFDKGLPGLVVTGTDFADFQDIEEEDFKAVAVVMTAWQTEG